MARSQQLTETFVSTVSAPGRYGDGRGGHGLSLLVKESSTGTLSKYWSQRLRSDGKPFNIGLGTYPAVTLAKARELARDNASLVTNGGDPRIPAPRVPTFAEAVDGVIANLSPAWKREKTERQWRATLETYAMPLIGNKPVSEVDTSDLMAILKPIWVDKPETARKLRQSIGLVMGWAIDKGHRADNPAGPGLAKELPMQRRHPKHYRVLDYMEVGRAIAKMRTTKARWGVKLCAEFLILTAARSSEARLATWSEINEDTGTWYIPASRMKLNFEHRVPLSSAALAVLAEAKESSGQEFAPVGDSLIFPSSTGKVLPSSALNNLFRKNDIDCTPHSIRSSFFMWAIEETDAPHPIVEHALGRLHRREIILTYLEAGVAERRRTLMEEWANFLNGTGDLSQDRN